MASRRSKRNLIFLDESEINDTLAEIEKKHLSPLKLCDEWPKNNSDESSSSDENSSESEQGDSVNSDSESEENSDEEGNFSQDVDDNVSDDGHVGSSSNMQFQRDFAESWGASRAHLSNLDYVTSAIDQATLNIDSAWEEIPAPVWQSTPDQTWRTSVLDNEYATPGTDYTLTNLSPVDPYASYTSPSPHVPVSQDDYSSSDHGDPDFVPQAQSSVTKKRGRPRKNISTASTSAADKGAPKKRGRPPKNPNTVSDKVSKKTKPLPKKLRATLEKKWTWLDNKPIDLYMQQFPFIGTPGTIFGWRHI